MNISQQFKNLLSYVSGAMSRIFGVSDDEYPATGVQPFSGDPPDRRHEGHR
jgi:hypothetical protein